LHPNTSYRDIVEMVTINSARALHQENLLGQIHTGSYADLIAIADPRKNDAFESIVGHSGPVHWSMIGGVAAES
jgi:imidazolonepropionase-like amidohydrolase